MKNFMFNIFDPRIGKILESKEKNEVFKTIFFIEESRCYKNTLRRLFPCNFTYIVAKIYFLFFINSHSRIFFL